MRIISALLMVLISLPASAGKLDDFEKSATKPKSEKRSSSSSSSSDSSGGFASSLLEALLRPVIEGTARMAVDLTTAGTAGSMQKTNKRLGKDVEIPDLSEGAESEFGVPLLQLDVGYGSGSEIQWSDLRAETGLGPFSLFMRKSQYVETNEEDDLEITNFGFNYRLFFGNRTEVSLGVGDYELDGNKTYKSGSFQFSINHQLRKNLGFEYSRVSVSGNNLNLADSEYSLLYGKDHWYARFFYRSMDTTDTSLDGIGMGLSLIY
jgi:hypothetical protein